MLSVLKGSQVHRVKALGICSRGRQHIILRKQENITLKVTIHECFKAMTTEMQLK